MARSTIENAGTGLFQLHGPQPDGSARAGDLLGTYEGDRYTDPADIERLHSPQVESDYLYEATDPHTGITDIIYVSALLTGTPMMNAKLIPPFNSERMEYYL